MLKTFAAETVPRGRAYKDFPVLVRVTGPALGNRRPGLDLVLVVDRVQSNWRTKVSMNRAVKFVIDHLDQKDRLAIVATDTPRPKTVVQLTEMNNESRKKLSRKDLGDEDGGVLEKALEQAVKVRRPLSRKQVSMCVYYSNGFLTTGPLGF
jgi:Mg-chelatase subunit ChlD